MGTNYDDRNKSQIIRLDARNCFVESKSDYFERNKVHFEFATYDTSKPEGKRQTNLVHIFIDMPEFLCLAHDALSNMLHIRARNQRAFNAEKEKENKKSEINLTPLFESLGGTSAERLAAQKRSRPDGKSLSRRVKLILANKPDSYLFVADSGPGHANKTGLIVPEKGAKPENHVYVSVTWQCINKFLRMTEIHYQAWLAAKYMAENGFNVLAYQGHPAETQQKPQTPKPNSTQKTNNTGTGFTTNNQGNSSYIPTAVTTDTDEMF